MRNISTAVRGHYDDDRYMWVIIIRRFCDSMLAVAMSRGQCKVMAALISSLSPTKNQVTKYKSSYDGLYSRIPCDSFSN
jgi:hypothetical protein